LLDSGQTPPIVPAGGGLSTTITLAPLAVVPVDVIGLAFMAMANSVLFVTHCETQAASLPREEFSVVPNCNC
jgi:hypothetical protein